MRWSLSAFLFALVLASCGSAPAFDCESTDPALRIGDRCPGASARLLPSVRIDGEWRGAGRDGACVADGDAVRCPVAELGDVIASASDGVASVRFEASADATVEGLSLEGEASLEGARAWISNGFQSWSQSGAIALGAPADDADLETALASRGDGEVIRKGTELSWEHTLIGGGPSTRLVGALAAARFRPWIQAYATDASDVVGVRIASGGAGERVEVAAGRSIEGEPFLVRVGDDPAALITEYGSRITSRHRDVPRDAEAGWNSWYELWDSVDEEAVRANAALARSILGPRVPEGTALRVVVDDGWQQRWGEWTPNEKFPSGLDGLASDLRADGFRVGVWLAPLLVDDDSALVTDHPGWFVGGAQYLHAKNGPMRILDVTNPEAAAHLAEVITTIVGWGYDLLKIDFLFAGTFEGERHEDVTPMEAYARALTIIRQAAGEDVTLVGVGSPAIATLPYVDAWRVGGDIALEPFDAAWPWIPNQARSVGARTAFCLATLCDADPALLRTLPREEVDTGAWVVALAGGALFLSDDLRALPSERPDWALDAARVSLSMSGAPAMPEDVLPEGAPRSLASALGDQLRNGRSSHVIPQRWRFPDGTRIAINATEEEIVVEGVSVPARASRLLQ